MARTASRRAVRDALQSAERVAGPTHGEAQLAMMPVTPLGKYGTTHFYLDSRQQLIELAARDHSRLGLQGLFGRQFKWLYDTAPRLSKEGQVTGWRPEKIAEELMAACDEIGIWDPDRHARGRGAWKGDAGELVLHLGNAVLTIPAGAYGWRDHERLLPGKRGRFVYPADEPIPAPADKRPSEGEGGPGDRLLTLLRTWSWRRPEIDPELLLGWIGAAMIGGALDWRPLMWLTGGKGTGKSTLQKIIEWMFGEAIVPVVDPSGASIWQALKRQTVPIAVDELEAEEDNRRATAVVKLARLAASGGVMRRGTADHRGVEFTVRSAFLFSSILIPPMMGQDRSRMAILEMDDLRPDARTPELVREKFLQLGGELRRRMVDGWGRIDATLAIYREALHKHGHTARGQDQFGVLLTCMDLLCNDHEPEADEALRWAAKLDARKMAEIDGDVRDEEMCIGHLLSTVIDPHRNGTRRTIAEWIAVAAGRVQGADATEAQRIILSYGVRYDCGPKRQETLAVANNHRGISEIFQNTHWAGRSGALGVYLQALRRLPGAMRSEAPLYFGTMSRAVVIPLDNVLPAEAGDRPLI